MAEALYSAAWEVSEQSEFAASVAGVSSVRPFRSSPQRWHRRRLEVLRFARCWQAATYCGCFAQDHATTEEDDSWDRGRLLRGVMRLCARIVVEQDAAEQRNATHR